MMLSVMSEDGRVDEGARCGSPVHKVVFLNGGETHDINTFFVATGLFPELTPGCGNDVQQLVLRCRPRS